MLPILNLGPLALPLAPLTLLLAVWVGLELAERHAPRFGADPNPIYRLTLAAILAGVVGARLAYAARFPQAFLASPLSLLAPQPHMLDLWGGLAAAFLAALIYGQRVGIHLWPALDALTSLFAVMAVGLGLSHLASGDAFGAPAALPWSIYLWGESRHPSQVYETMAALAILAAVWPGSPLAREGQPPGMRFWAFVALTAGARLFLEAFRGDSALLLDQFRLAQVVAWGVLAIGLWNIHHRLVKKI